LPLSKLVGPLTPPETVSVGTPKYNVSPKKSGHLVGLVEIAASSKDFTPWAQRSR
jgi:hypothetical protein